MTAEDLYSFLDGAPWDAEEVTDFGSNKGTALVAWYRNQRSNAYIEAPALHTSPHDERRLVAECLGAQRKLP